MTVKRNSDSTRNGRGVNDTPITTGPGRCTACGWHFKTQGHNPNCPGGTITPDSPGHTSTTRPFVDWLQGQDAHLTALKRGDSPSERQPKTRPRRTVRVSDAWAQAALRNKVSELAALGKDSGRNNALNEAAWRLAKLGLDQSRCRQELLDACRRNGLIAEDGMRACCNTFDSGWQAGLEDSQ